MISSIIYTDTKAYLDKVLDQALLNSLQLSEDKLLTEIEIIQMIERDFPNLNKEFCGYSLKEQEHESLIFSVQ